MKLKSIVFSFSFVFFLLSSCTNIPTDIRSGNWHYFTDFGEFTLTVSPDGNSITGVKYKIYCGQQSPTGSYELPEDFPGSAIEKNKFDLSLTVAGQITITNWKAKFNREGNTLSGTWSVVEGLCSKEFSITR
ncbi:MAG: hypothetical protein JXJ22_07465 [Bacteroidales bacterium]|nr:hypothetical protein [Bacteroidales bacterium]